MVSKILFYFLLIISFTQVVSQVYSPEIEPTNLTIESNVYPGFKTFLDFDSKDVRKGWWKFSREFGKPVNMRRYYETTLVHEEMMNVKVITRSVKFKEGTLFYLTLKNDEMPKDQEQKYLKQVKTLLFEFKQEYYRSFLEDELKSLEKQAVQVTKKLDKVSGDATKENQYFDSLMEVNTAMDEVKERVKKLQ
ncbi:MAG: hypothetical protein RLO17_06670 [Cyclobacteriaceae bacterium]|tara:strand:+ start:193 stop:768 length:576 start_codon:yes stop_codon:yes gene_type:complete